MKRFPIFSLSVVVAAGLLTSCQSTIPDAAALDRYYKQVEHQSRDEIAALEAQRASGRISQELYDQEMEGLRAEFTQKANNMAWARYELAESEKRALGIPTTESNVPFTNPGNTRTRRFESGGVYTAPSQQAMNRSLQY